MDGFDKKGRRSVDRTSHSTLTILGDKIPSKALNYGVNFHQMKLKTELSIAIHCYSNV
jgi:hypothetical protein